MKFPPKRERNRLRCGGTTTKKTQPYRFSPGFFFFPISNKLANPKVIRPFVGEVGRHALVLLVQSCERAHRASSFQCPASAAVVVLFEKVELYRTYISILCSFGGCLGVM